MGTRPTVALMLDCRCIVKVRRRAGAEAIAERYCARHRTVSQVVRLATQAATQPHAEPHARMFVLVPMF